MLIDCGDGFWVRAASVMAIGVAVERKKAVLKVRIDGTTEYEETFDSYGEAKVQGDRIAAAVNAALSREPPRPAGS